MTNLSEVKTGQELFLYSGNRRSPRESTAIVSKVGRKYVYLDGYREPVEIGTGRSWHGDYNSNAHYNGHGFTAYLSKADWQREQREKQVREKFRESFRDYVTMAERLPLDMIKRIMNVLDCVEWEGDR